MKSWGLAADFVLAGMWIYGVSQGIYLVITEGLDFSSRIGALSNAIIFLVVFIFDIFMLYNSLEDVKYF